MKRRWLRISYVSAFLVSASISAVHAEGGYLQDVKAEVRMYTFYFYYPNETDSFRSCRNSLRQLPHSFFRCIVNLVDFEF